MSKKNYYGVKVGKIVGVFENWNDCQQSIAGYPCAEYKGFSTFEEAEAYVSGVNVYQKQVENDIAEGYVVAYTDGSFNEEKDEYSYGICIIDLNKNEIDLCCKMNYPQFVPSKNIAGEIFGVLTALDWAMSNGYEKIKIYHDLEGIAKWASGEFRADSPIAQFYVERLKQRFIDFITFEFVKVAGHTNNPYNEKADRLAASAFEGERRIISGANSFTVNNFSKEDLNAILSLIQEDIPEAKTDRKAILGGEQIKFGFGKKNYTTIKLYDNNKLLVQGLPNSIFQILLTYVTELLGKDEIIPLVKQAYRISIDAKKLSDNYDNLCPNIPEKYNESIKTLIRQAIINLTHYFVSEDYGQYAYPALRALEGHLKYLFELNSIHVEKEMHYFDGDEINGYTLKSSIVISDPDKTNIEKCYTHFHKIRHKVFHFGEIFGDSDDTYLIKSKEEADEIINQTLALINETAR